MLSATEAGTRKWVSEGRDLLPGVLTSDQDAGRVGYEVVDVEKKMLSDVRKARGKQP